MRRATNNKRGRWMEVGLMSGDKTILAGTFYAYEMRQQGETKYYVVFTKDGELYETYDKVFVAVEIEPPAWAKDLWDVSDEAGKVNHYAQLYDARNKTVICDSDVVGIQRAIWEYQRNIDFLSKLKTLEPWG